MPATPHPRPRPPDPASPSVIAQRIVPALHGQRWTLERGLSHAIHLQSGSGRLLHDEGELPLRMHDVVWMPAGSGRTLSVAAGSAGVRVGVGDSLLAAAMGERPAMAALRQVSLRRCAITAAEPAAREELVRSLLAIESESRREAQASTPYLLAHLTLLLVMLWRLSSSAGDEGPAAAAVAPRLLRFRHLVEAQYRAHWRLSRYAAELGISTDRLHELCRGSLGRSPLELVHQRLVREACSLLAGTELAIERVAADLGFGSTSHFSRFFKRWLQQSPSAWRAHARAQAAAGRAALPASYADWP